MRKKKKQTLERSWYYLVDPNRERERRTLRWVTVIIGALRLRRADVWHQEGRLATIAEVARMAAEYRSTWTGLTRGRHLSGMTWRGALELAVERQIEPGSHCATTLAAMGVDASPLAPDERLIVVHAHLVLAVDDVEAIVDELDGERWADHVRGVLKQAWPGPWRTLVKSLRADQSVRTAITRLCSYCHKQVTRYVENGTGYGDVPTRYADHYEPAWRLLVRQTYRAIDVELRSRR